MKYIIPVKVLEDYEHSKQFEEALKKFIDERAGYFNTFEIFDSINTRTRAFYPYGDKRHNFDYVRFCTTDPRNCYEGATFSGAFDFDSDLDTYFIEVSADDKFNASGAFYPRAFTQHNKRNPENKSTNVQIVGIDYIVKGELKDENQS